MSKKKTGLDNAKRQRISDRVLILTLFVQILFLVNLSLGTYIMAAQSMHASMVEPTGETLQVHIETDTGRHSLVETLLSRVRDWVGSYYVGGVERTQATTGITISVTGSNVGSTASVNYYIEARSGEAVYRFLAGNGSSVSVGGSSLQVSNQTSIENHLTAMGLSTTSSHTIDYYVYVIAETTGAVSGEPLTTEIVYTKFDTVSYQYGSIANALVYVDSDGYTDYYSSSSSHSGDTKIWVEKNIYEIYLRFNLAAYSDIQSAQLKLYLTNYGGDGTRHIDLLSTASWTGNPTYSTRPSILANLNTQGFAPSGGWKTWTDTAYAPTRSGAMAYYGLKGTDTYLQTEFYARETGGTTYIPRLLVSYMSYSSWYPLPPLSLADLPITLDVVAMVALIAATAYTLQSRRKKQ